MSRDNCWVPSGRLKEFHFQACSGTRRRQIDTEPWQGYVQLNEIPPNIGMMVLQAGGNNPGFADIAYACIFQTEYDDQWGPEYPDPDGKCTQALNRDAKYIYSEGVDQLFQDTHWIVNTIFGHDHIKGNPNFQLFVPGYFQFFYDKGRNGDWCGGDPFALRYNNRPTLSSKLRLRINELIRGLNDGIKAGIEDNWYPSWAKFVDTDTKMDGHRFCEIGHNIYGQYYGDKVWLWNMGPESVVFGSGSSSGVDGNDGYKVRQSTEAEFEHWRETDRFTDDPSEIPFNMTLAAAAAMGRNDVLTKDDPSWANMIGPFQQNYPGFALRPFHPKKSGYHEMARAIQHEVKMSLDSDQLPTISPLLLPRSNPQHSIQIMVRKTLDTK